MSFCVDMRKQLTCVSTTVQASLSNTIFCKSFLLAATLLCPKMREGGATIWKAILLDVKQGYLQLLTSSFLAPNKSQGLQQLKPPHIFWSNPQVKFSLDGKEISEVVFTV